MNKWTSSKTPGGKQRPLAVMSLFAINTAFAEMLPFTVLNACNVPGNNVTHNA